MERKMGRRQINREKEEKLRTYLMKIRKKETIIEKKENEQDKKER